MGLPKTTVISKSSDSVIIETAPCPVCKDVKQLCVKIDDYLKWQQGKLFTREAFPDLSAEDRDRLVLGTCIKCVDKQYEEYQNAKRTN